MIHLRARKPLRQRTFALYFWEPCCPSHRYLLLRNVLSWRSESIPPWLAHRLRPALRLCLVGHRTSHAGESVWLEVALAHGTLQTLVFSSFCALPVQTKRPSRLWWKEKSTRTKVLKRRLWRLRLVTKASERAEMHSDRLSPDRPLFPPFSQL